MEGRLDQVSKKRLEYYQRYINHFVTVTKQDGFVVAGILKDITPDNHLFIIGTHKEVIFHFSEIKEFSARPDRQKKGDSNY